MRHIRKSIWAKDERQYEVIYGHSIHDAEVEAKRLAISKKTEVRLAFNQTKGALQRQFNPDGTMTMVKMPV